MTKMMWHPDCSCQFAERVSGISVDRGMGPQPVRYWEQVTWCAHHLPDKEQFFVMEPN